MSTYDSPGAPWRRKHDYESESIVGHARAFPTTVAAIVDIVRAAEASGPEPEARAAGSHWALSTAAVTEGWQIETHDPDSPPNPRHADGGLNRVLYEVVPDCLTVDAWSFLRAQNVPPFHDTDPSPFDPLSPNFQKFNLVCVEAGMRIWEVYAHLDSLPTGRSVAHVLGNYEGPWAMPTLGGAGGQTIVGAFSTGTHGGDVRSPPIVDAVAAVHLVGAQGQQYWIEGELAPGVPLIDEAKLNALYPGVKVLREPETLNAVIVGAGRFGVICSAVLKVVRQYALHEWRSEDSWTDVRAWLGDPTAAHFNNHFLQVVVNPNGTASDMHEHTCYVSARSAHPLIDAVPPVIGMPSPYGREQRGVLGSSAGARVGLLDTSDFLNAICADGLPVSLGVGVLIGTLEGVRAAAYAEAVAAIVVLVSPWPFGKPAAAAALAAAYLVIELTNDLISALEALQSGLSHSLGEGMAQLGNWCAENDKLEYLRMVNEMILSGALDPSIDVTAISYAIMDTTNYLDVYCTPAGDSLEVFFDASTADSSTKIVAFVDYLLERVAALENGFVTGERLAVAGWASLRFTGPTKALLGMQRWPRTCAIEVACPSGARGTEVFLADLEQFAIAQGATLHWGQRNQKLGFGDVEKSYDAEPGGSLYKWRDALAKLSRNGRDITFRTPFTVARGLEVVQPRVGAFTAVPHHAPVGAQVTCVWNAADNPPGTEAWLEVRGASPSPAMKLDALDGTTTLPMPASDSQLVLRVSYKPYDRTRTDERVIDVQGFADYETWVFEPQEVLCWNVGGTSRWGGELNFYSQFISDELRVAAVRCAITNLPTVNAAKWWVQTPGVSDAEFTLGQEEHVFTGSLPVLNRRWLFYVDDAGCLPPAPVFRVEFILVSAP